MKEKESQVAIFIVTVNIQGPLAEGQPSFSGSDEMHRLPREFCCSTGCIFRKIANVWMFYESLQSFFYLQFCFQTTRVERQVACLLVGSIASDGGILRALHSD